MAAQTINSRQEKEKEVLKILANHNHHMPNNETMLPHLLQFRTKLSNMLVTDCYSGRRNSIAPLAL